jgi:hypothetical protein
MVTPAQVSGAAGLVHFSGRRRVRGAHGVEYRRCDDSAWPLSAVEWIRWLEPEQEAA